MTESNKDEDSQPPATSGDDATPPEVAGPEPITFAEFLEGTPPSQTMPVADLLETVFTGARHEWQLTTPDLQLHCTSDVCNGPRIYRFDEAYRLSGKVPSIRKPIPDLPLLELPTQPAFLGSRSVPNPPAGTYKFGEIRRSVADAHEASAFSGRTASCS